jgi:hypothetical protein
MLRPGRPPKYPRVREIMQERGCSYLNAYYHFRLEQAANGQRPMRGVSMRVAELMSQHNVTEHEARTLEEAEVILARVSSCKNETGLSPLSNSLGNETGDTESQRSSELSTLKLKAQQAKASRREAKLCGDNDAVVMFNKLYVEARDAYVAAGGTEDV